MRNLIIIIFVSILSCNQNSKRNDALIENFENFLGKTELNYLDEIVADFDNFLISNYPEQKSKFKAYLTDLSEMKEKNIWKVDSLKLKKYKESKLFGKHDTIYPDSVWFDGITFNIKYLDFELIEELIPLKTNEVLNIDSSINSLKKEPRFVLKEQSNYYLALDSIQKSDSLIITYLEAKECAGNISPSILAGGLMYYLTEKNEYFAKRIFVMEMLD